MGTLFESSYRELPTLCGPNRCAALTAVRAWVRDLDLCLVVADLTFGPRPHKLTNDELTNELTIFFRNTNPCMGSCFEKN